MMAFPRGEKLFLCIFGGIDESGSLTNDLCVVSYREPAVFYNYRYLSPAPGSGPCPRRNAATALLQGSVYVYGGIGMNFGREVRVADFWVIAIPCKGALWTSLPIPPSNAPSGEGVCLSAGGDNCLVLSGGKPQLTLSLFDCEARQWTRTITWDVEATPNHRLFMIGQSSGLVFGVITPDKSTREKVVWFEKWGDVMTVVKTDIAPMHNPQATFARVGSQVMIVGRNSWDPGFVFDFTTFRWAMTVDTIHPLDHGLTGLRQAAVAETDSEMFVHGGESHGTKNRSSWLYHASGTAFTQTNLPDIPKDEWIMKSIRSRH
jgi:hypothetical protein